MRGVAFLEKNQIKKNKNLVFVVGAALFSMFFGAGNLIFPPELGLLSGSKWIWALIGFGITGIGLPIMGVIASSKAGGDVDKLGRKVSPLFSKFLGISVVISIGPLLAIPRTGATAFEVGIQPTFPGFSPVLFAIIYFGITLALVMKPNNVVDNIGKVLTPVLLLILGLIIVKGVISPMGPLVESKMAQPFATGFTGGYQTMDALTSILFGGIITASLVQGGFTEEKEQMSMTIKSGLIAAAGLIVVYGGLGYLGATAGTVYPSDISKTELIINIATNSLGRFGNVGLGIVVSLACLTTAVALTTTVGQYFESISKGKIKYQWSVIATTVFSGIMSVSGVESIVVFAEPILIFMYPLVIVLVILSIFLAEDANKNIYRTAIYVTLAISILQLLNNLGILTSVTQVVNYLPLASMELGWVVPAVIGTGIGMMIPESQASKNQ